jgi:hypothetical protein
MTVDRTTLKISVAKGHGAEIGFEPIGTSFVVGGGDFLVLDLPANAVREVDIVHWPNGIAVWVPFPGDYIVFNSSGTELDRL